MSRFIHEGPTHISVDGTIANPFVLAAVLVVAGFVAIAGFMAWSRGRRTIWLVIGAATVIAIMSSGELLHHLAFELTWLLGGGRTPATYFGVPPRWPVPLAFAIGAAIAFFKKWVRENARRRSSHSGF